MNNGNVNYRTHFPRTGEITSKVKKTSAVIISEQLFIHCSKRNIFLEVRLVLKTVNRITLLAYTVRCIFMNINCPIG